VRLADVTTQHRGTRLQTAVGEADYSGDSGVPGSLVGLAISGGVNAGFRVPLPTRQGFRMPYASRRVANQVFARGSWSETMCISDTLRKETVGGVLLLASAASAVIWADSAWAPKYEALRDMRVGTDALGLHLNLTLGTWVSDGLLAVFFLVVGLELKREFVAGDLRDSARAALPIAAAAGGMVVPGAIFVAMTYGRWRHGPSCTSRVCTLPSQVCCWDHRAGAESQCEAARNRLESCRTFRAPASPVFGIALLSGIGFTVALLIGELAYGVGSERDERVKIGVLTGSLLAAMLAAIVLRLRNRQYRLLCGQEAVDRDRDGVPEIYVIHEGPARPAPVEAVAFQVERPLPDDTQSDCDPPGSRPGVLPGDR
jgi:Na+/H+ antiporter 1